MLPRSGTSRLLRFTLLPFFIFIFILVSSASRAFAQEPASPTLPAGEVLVVRAGDLWLLNPANDDAIQLTDSGDVSPSGSTGPAAVPAHVVVPAATAVPVPQPTPCLITVDSRLADLWNRTSLGCPTGNAFLTWASWTPYERGQIVWRLDTNRVYGFFNSGWWRRFEEQWDEVSVGPSRGPTPQGLFEPTRGTGWLWRTNDTMYNELGWARDDQHGFCALVQNFDNGFVVRSNMIEFCQDNLYNTAREGDWPLDSIVAINNGNWSLRGRVFKRCACMGKDTP